MARKQTIEADVTEADVDGAATAKSRSYGLNRFKVIWNQ